MIGVDVLIKGSSRSRVAEVSSSSTAIGDGVTAAGEGSFWQFRQAQGLGSSMLFSLSSGLLCKMAGTAIHVSLSVVSVFVRVCIRFPYPVIQIWLIKKNMLMLLYMSKKSKLICLF
jgi:hypothetical protein